VPQRKRQKRGAYLFIGWLEEGEEKSGKGKSISSFRPRKGKERDRRRLVNLAKGKGLPVARRQSRNTVTALKSARNRQWPIQRGGELELEKEKHIEAARTPASAARGRQRHHGLSSVACSGKKGGAERMSWEGEGGGNPTDFFNAVPWWLVAEPQEIPTLREELSRGENTR